MSYDLSETALATQFSNEGGLYNVTTSSSVAMLGGTGLGNSTGVLSQYLDPGIYTFYLSTANGDSVNKNGLASVSGSHSEHYDFQISAAPEPSLWMLLLSSVGFAGLPTASRRSSAGSTAGV